MFLLWIFSRRTKTSRRMVFVFFCGFDWSRFLPMQTIIISIMRTDLLSTRKTFHLTSCTIQMQNFSLYFCFCFWFFFPVDISFLRTDAFLLFSCSTWTEFNCLENRVHRTVQRNWFRLNWIRKFVLIAEREFDYLSNNVIGETHLRPRIMWSMLMLVSYSIDHSQHLLSSRY